MLGRDEEPALATASDAKERPLEEAEEVEWRMLDSYVNVKEDRGILGKDIKVRIWVGEEGKKRLIWGKEIVMADFTGFYCISPCSRLNT